MEIQTGKPACASYCQLREKWKTQGGQGKFILCALCALWYAKWQVKAISSEKNQAHSPDLHLSEG